MLYVLCCFASPFSTNVTGGNGIVDLWHSFLLSLDLALFFENAFKEAIA